MDSLHEYLVKLSDTLDKEGKKECSDAVDGLIKASSVQKVAQYVGVIGYVLRQNRAMSNCVRKKRASSKGSMQDVVLDCLKEYQDGQNYQDTQWTSKYAQVIQTEPDKFDTSHLHFLSNIGSDNEIELHIDSIRKTAELFIENQVDEVLFNTMIEHISTFGEILNKEVKFRHPFKLAAAPNRGWWSRNWNPSELSANPRSWSSKNRNRGADKDVQQSVSNISNMLSQVRGFINQKNMSNEYELANQSLGLINQIQQEAINMQSKPAIRGREAGNAPALYLDAFLSSLNAFKRNPLDEKFYSDSVYGLWNQFHSRLYTRGDQDNSYERMRETLNTMGDPDDPFADQPGTAEDPSSTPDSAPASPIPEGAVNSAVEELRREFGGNAAKALSYIEPVFQGDERAKDVIQKMKMMLSSPSSGTPASPDPVDPASAATPTPDPAATPSPDPVAAPETGPATRPVPRRGYRPMPTASCLDTVTKIADVLDGVDKSLADILDEYLENNKDVLSELPEFPEVSSLIKEEKTELLNK